jgi:predicted O-methyltransferase YrrM
MGAEESPNQNAAIRQVRLVVERLARDGSVVARSDGAEHNVFPVAISSEEGEALRRWVLQEGAEQTLEIGLGYGFSALHICEGLLLSGNLAARHVVLDPNQAERFGDCGLQVLEDAGVRRLVEHYAELSEIALPRFLEEGRHFDLGFVDGNHRFDGVFLDLFYLGRLVRGGGIVFLDDYNLPGVKKAVSYFVNNRAWAIEESSTVESEHQWVVLRTPAEPSQGDFRYFVDS